MNGLMALFCPTTNSMRCIIKRGAFKLWGYSNHEAAIRVPSNACKPSLTHFELKTSDACGNPYIVLGAIIAAGMDGIKCKLPISPPYQGDSRFISEEELKKKNDNHNSILSGLVIYHDRKWCKPAHFVATLIIMLLPGVLFHAGNKFAQRSY